MTVTVQTVRDSYRDIACTVGYEDLFLQFIQVGSLEYVHNDSDDEGSDEVECDDSID